MAHETVLIVDDNALNLKLARLVLEGAGFEVRTAEDTPHAREVLATFRPRLILMDIQLPGIDGLEFTRQLKATKEYRDIVIVALTSYAMRGDEEKALASGCQGYLTKPLDTRSLPSTVAGFLAGATP